MSRPFTSNPLGVCQRTMATEVTIGWYNRKLSRLANVPVGPNVSLIIGDASCHVIRKRVPGTRQTQQGSGSWSRDSYGGPVTLDCHLSSCGYPNHLTTKDSHLCRKHMEAYSFSSWRVKFEAEFGDWECQVYIKVEKGIIAMSQKHVTSNFEQSNIFCHHFDPFYVQLQ